VRLAQGLARRDEDGILARHLRQAEGSGIAIEQVFAAARAGDEATISMLNDRARYMGIALANLVNTFNPELILLGGILAQGQDLLLPVMEATMRQQAFANLGEQVQLKTTSLGRQAGIVGAATLALDAFFYQQPDRPPEVVP
jgi:predicted NBD/HSP70 family sugar kinase